MAGKKDNKPLAENQEAFNRLLKKSPEKKAAGLPAVISAVKMITREAGIARGSTALFKLNQKTGFDCPSCAWPDPDDERSSIGEYCENGARSVADEATKKKLDPTFFAKYSVYDLSQMSDYALGKMGRLAHPMYLPKGATHYQAISWESAFDKIAHTLHSLSSPDEAIFYTSGRTSNEAAYLYQLFVRAFGTNNLPDCSNMCHESSGIALTESLGIGKGSVKLDDFYMAEVIIIIGQNPGTNHPRMLSALQKAKANGAIIISINPLPESGLMAFANPQQLSGILGQATALTDIFLQVKINGDMPLLQAICKCLLREEAIHPGKVIDQTFISNRTQGFEQWAKHLHHLTLDQLSEACGISVQEIEFTALALSNKNRIIACWAMGLTQHVNAVNTIKEVVNLLLLKGSIGKPGTGTCPVRGHSNVQGDRTMGIYEKPSPLFLDSLEKKFEMNLPRNHGYDVVESIKAMHNGRAKVFFAMGGNFLSATPDTRYTAEALRNCQLTVQVSTKLNRSHLVTGEEALILPCLGRSDKDIIHGKEQVVSCENSMGVVQSSKGVLKPVSEHLLSEPVIVCRLAMATLPNITTIPWQQYSMDYDTIRKDIAQTIQGFENYNERLRQPGGFYLPNCNREGQFNTPSGKAQFNTADFMPLVLQKDELMMMTIRSHDQFNTTIYGLNDRYRGIYNERRIIFMHLKDMQDRNISEGEVVDLLNQSNGTTRWARNFKAVAYAIPPGCAATYFPEANPLVPLDSVAEKSNTPTSKQIPIQVIKSAGSAVRIIQ